MKIRITVLTLGMALSFSASGFIEQTLEECQSDKQNTRMMTYLIATLDEYNLRHIPGRFLQEHRDVMETYNLGFAVSKQLTLYKDYLTGNSFNLNVSHLPSTFSNHLDSAKSLFNSELRTEALTAALPPSSNMPGSLHLIQSTLSSFRFQGAWRLLRGLTDLRTTYTNTALQTKSYPLPYMNAQYWIVVQEHIEPFTTYDPLAHPQAPRISSHVLQHIADNAGPGFHWLVWNLKENPEVTFYCPYRSRNNSIVNIEELDDEQLIGTPVGSPSTDTLISEGNIIQSQPDDDAVSWNSLSVSADDIEKSSEEYVTLELMKVSAQLSNKKRFTYKGTIYYFFDGVWLSRQMTQKMYP